MTAPDLRPQLAASQEWVATLIDGVRPEELDSPTPCDDFTVGELIEHMLAVEERVRRIGADGVLGDAQQRVALPTGDLGAAFREAAGRAHSAWDDDSRLTAIVSPPWGDVPGAAALGGYVQEHLTHGWDLAVATGQPAEADPHLVEPVLQAAMTFVPAAPRGGPIPFGDVVEPAADAGPTERLANYLGRTSR